jgi:ATP-dependent Clp protease ATP-binding subunit ClpC
MTASTDLPFSRALEQAEALARRRNEAPHSLHLLVAIAGSAGATAELLQERGVLPRRLLDVWEKKEARGTDNLIELARRVRDSARRFGRSAPEAGDALLVLLNDSLLVAHKVLLELQVPIPTLRSAVIQSLQGLPMRKRTQLESLGSLQKEAGASDERSYEPRPSRVQVRDLGGVDPGARPAGEPVPLVPPERARVPIPMRRASSRVLDPERSRRGSSDGELVGPEVGSPEPGVSLGNTGRFLLSKQRFPILSTLGQNWTALADQQSLDPVRCRDAEVDQVQDILAKREANSPCLIGPPGVGKTSIVRALAMRIAAAPEGASKDDRIIVEVPISELLSGTGVRGALAHRFGLLKKELLEAEGRVVLFFDEIHRLFLGEGAEEISSELKLSLTRGEIVVLGATSPEEYRRMVERDPAMLRRLTAVAIDEPSREDGYLMVSSAISRLEAHHALKYDEEAVALSIAWSVRYLSGRALPDKALSILDLAGARAGRRQLAVVDASAVAEVVAAQASMPVERLLESDAERMLHLEHAFSRRVIGHELELGKIARILRRNAAGLGQKRPIGTFLLLGPTGVGKTETAKAIAEVMFQNENAMTRIDMAELSESHAVAKLIGAPPGYVGHDAGGQLTEAVRQRPYQVILLDEIEKAHGDVLTAFLAVFDEGRMTDSRGRTVDFTNTVIVLTSNLGARETESGGSKKVGFRAAEGDASAELRERIVAVARRALLPELYNRLDEVLVFTPLSRESIHRIGRLIAQNLAREVFESRGIHLRLTDMALSYLLDSGGYEPGLGARPLRRQLAREVEAPLAEAILEGRVQSGATYQVDLEVDRLRVTIRSGSPLAAE